jgi:hypothetical protein
MSTLSIEKSQNLESAAPKKGNAKSNAPSRRKVIPATVTAKKPLRSVESKAKRGAAAKTPVKADEPKVEPVTKKERMLTLLSRPGGRASQR